MCSKRVVIVGLLLLFFCHKILNIWEEVSILITNRWVADFVTLLVRFLSRKWQFSFYRRQDLQGKNRDFLGCYIFMPKIYPGPSEDHQTEQICSAKSCGQTWEYIECGGVVHSIMANICNFSPILYPPPSLQDTGRAFCAAPVYLVPTMNQLRHRPATYDLDHFLTHSYHHSSGQIPILIVTLI